MVNTEPKPKPNRETSLRRCAVISSCLPLPLWNISKMAVASNEISKAWVAVVSNAVASNGNEIISMVKLVVVVMVKTHSSTITMTSDRMVEARSAMMVVTNRVVAASKQTKYLF